MKYKEISNLLKKRLALDKIFIKGIEKNIEIIAIGDIFINLNSLKRQQLIYKVLLSYFEKNIIHAISIKTYSIKEWRKIKQLKILESHKNSD